MVVGESKKMLENLPPPYNILGYYGKHFGGLGELMGKYRKPLIPQTLIIWSDKTHTQPVGVVSINTIIKPTTSIIKPLTHCKNALSVIGNWIGNLSFFISLTFLTSFFQGFDAINNES